MSGINAPLFFVHILTFPPYAFGYFPLCCWLEIEWVKVGYPSLPNCNGLMSQRWILTLGKSDKGQCRLSSVLSCQSGIQAPLFKVITLIYGWWINTHVSGHSMQPAKCYYRGMWDPKVTPARGWGFERGVLEGIGSNWVKDEKGSFEAIKENIKSHWTGGIWVEWEGKRVNGKNGKWGKQAVDGLPQEAEELG